MKAQPEHQLQTMICQYLCLQYPDVLFLSDVRAAMKLTIPQQVRAKKIQKQGFKCPDLIIFASTQSSGALFLEIKTESPFTKSGGLKSSDHLRAQADALSALRMRGYDAWFVWTFDQAKERIDGYLQETKQKEAAA